MRRAVLAMLSTAALGAFVAAPARAQTRSRPSDAQLQATVEHALADKEIGDVHVSVADGQVRLTGMVPDAWAREEAERIALDAKDVKKVIDDLTVARAESDAALAEAVSSQVRRYVLYSVFDDVRIAVKDGTVTLSGEVTAPYKAHDLAKIVSRVRGVEAVESEIRALPVSLVDDQLRAEIASRLYGDPVFERYALQVPPPIHIVVENGRVTLTGAVGSEVEKVKAGFTARDVFGVMSVDNELKVAS
jgi:osmotically-inducible protein OsmY